MKKMLLAVALATVPAPGLSADVHSPPIVALPDADPAMWVVKDEDTTIYLFGTFHALDGKREWFNEEVKEAFDRSDELVIEALLPDNPADLKPLIAKHGIAKDGKTLTARLSEDGRKRLAQALTELGAPATAFDQFKPSFATTMLVSLNAAKLGITPENGSEQILKAAAKSLSKPVSAIETADFQLGMLNGFPEPMQVKMLEESLFELDQLFTLFGKMKDLWYQGDAEGFVTVMDQMSSESPAAHKTVFTDRNATWAAWIDRRLDKPGVIFMAVGTGHLAGKNSVQHFLAQKGIKVKRAA